MGVQTKNYCSAAGDAQLTYLDMYAARLVRELKEGKTSWQRIEYEHKNINDEKKREYFYSRIKYYHDIMRQKQ